jgi:uncharacterized protein involved in exopolysaccharide biosynthesis
MSTVTSGPGPLGPSAPKPEEPSGKTRTKRPLPEVPPIKAPTAAPPRVDPPPDVPVLNGHTPDTDVARQGPAVVVRPRQRSWRQTLRWPALVLLALVFVGAGAWAGSTVAARMPTLYAAQADIIYPLVQEQPTGFLRQDRNLSTQEVLIESRSVLDPVAVQFGIPVDDLTEHLTTEVVDESEVIRLQFTDPSRTQGQEVLAAVVAQYVAISNNPARAAVRQYLDVQLADVRARLVTARAEADAVDALGLSQAAQAQVDALVTREAALLAQLDEEQFAAIAGPAPKISVAPYVERDPVSPNRLLVTGGGALAGLVVGLIVVAVLARRMTRH